MAFAGDPLFVGGPLQPAALAAGRAQAQHGKRASDEGMKMNAGAAGAKKGRGPFGDITNRHKQQEASAKELAAAAGKAAFAPTAAAQSPAAEPTPCHLIKKKLRLSCNSDQSAADQHEVSPPRPTWVDIDRDPDPLACKPYVNQLYANLKAAEMKKRPSVDYMETVQGDVNASMRGILVDWLVEVAQEYKLHSDTLYLTVGYLDRYLSARPVPRNELQLVGVTCMLIASKYEEIYAPTVDDFCYITDHTYSREQILAAEERILDALRFEVTAPTPKLFLRRYLKAAAAECVTLDPRFELLANYLLELSLLEYRMLGFLPSQTAASAVLLALFLLECAPHWSRTLRHYTGYAPRELRDCTGALHELFKRAHAPNALPAVKEKYAHSDLATCTIHVDELPLYLFAA